MSETFAKLNQKQKNQSAVGMARSPPKRRQALVICISITFYSFLPDYWWADTPTLRRYIL
ncbi:MAG: hypothetical protein IKI22_05310 [Neisseriaceae bacterium]|nr:hypothetical protein [Neisseriaceae bacterium]